MTTNPTDTQLQGETLEKCPWCPVKTELSLYHLPDSPSRHVYCRRCNGAGPWGDSDDEAITVWNSRAAVAGPSLASVKEAIKSVQWSSNKSNPETMSTPNKDLGRYMQDVLAAVENTFAATSSPAPAEPKCIHCQHSINDFNAVTGLCEFDPEPENESAEFCGCKCEFTPAESIRVTGEHPEDSCHKCGRPNIVWFAPNSLWNKAVRDANEREILCPVCFVQLAAAAGFDDVWRVAPQNYSGTSDSARRAADEWFTLERQQMYKIFNIDHPAQIPPYLQRQREKYVAELAAIISKYFAAAPADDDAEQYAQIAERLYGPHDRRFRVAIEVADAIRRTTKGDR